MGLHEETVERVREIISEMAPVAGIKAEPSMDLINEMGYESVAFMELALALESEFNLFSFDEEQAGEMTTVGDIETLIADLVVSAAHA